MDKLCLLDRSEEKLGPLERWLDIWHKFVTFPIQEAEFYETLGDPDSGQSGSKDASPPGDNWQHS
jgi:hypothetical protein